jgi:hypothetical protein
MNAFRTLMCLSVLALPGHGTRPSALDQQRTPRPRWASPPGRLGSPGTHATMPLARARPPLDEGRARLALRVLAAAVAAGPPRGKLWALITSEALDPIRGVKVTVTPEAGTGVPRSAYTNDEGMAHLEELPVGSCSVVATAPRLTPVIETGVQVAAGRWVGIGFTMASLSPPEELSGEGAELAGVPSAESEESSEPP